MNVSSLHLHRMAKNTSLLGSSWSEKAHWTLSKQESVPREMGPRSHSLQVQCKEFCSLPALSWGKQEMLKRYQGAGCPVAMAELLQHKDTRDKRYRGIHSILTDHNITHWDGPTGTESSSLLPKDRSTQLGGSRQNGQDLGEHPPFGNVLYIAFL